MNIARKWPTLMLQWESVESKLPKWRNQYEKRQLAYNVRMVAIAILLSSLGSYSAFATFRVQPNCHERVDQLFEIPNFPMQWSMF